MAWPRRCAVRALEALKWLRHSGGLENPTRWVGAGAISVRRLQMETSVLVFLVWLAVALRCATLRGSGPAPSRSAASSVRRLKNETLVLVFWGGVGLW